MEENKEEHDAIMALTNPAVRKKLLETFAEQCDSSATDLKATALPRQATKVILPITTIKEDEVYAPSYKNGERLVLIRYPHAGTFEIPELVVNNNNARGKDIIGKDAADAIGIHPKVAARLSGADFDGDTVMVLIDRLHDVADVITVFAFGIIHERYRKTENGLSAIHGRDAAVLLFSQCESFSLIAEPGITVVSYTVKDDAFLDAKRIDMVVKISILLYAFIGDTGCDP